jgi:hypothetical protein
MQKALTTKDTKEHKGEGSDDLLMVGSGDLKKLVALAQNRKNVFEKRHEGTRW